MSVNTEKYIIPYQGLSAGSHQEEFKVTDALFKGIEGSEITSGACDVTIGLEKGLAGLSLHLHIQGAVTLPCDRCLDIYMQEIDYEGDVFVRFSHEHTGYDIDSATGNDLLWVRPEEELDLTHYIYESICLSLPVQRVHPHNSLGESLCNKEMLARFLIAPDEDEDEEEE